eukprot:scaffold136504_cov154-Phaeocystis_antarctica.AAC.1
MFIGHRLTTTAEEAVYPKELSARASVAHGGGHLGHLGPRLSSSPTLHFTLARAQCHGLEMRLKMGLKDQLYSVRFTHAASPRKE